MKNIDMKQEYYNINTVLMKVHEREIAQFVICSKEQLNKITLALVTEKNKNI